MTRGCAATASRYCFSSAVCAELRNFWMTVETERYLRGARAHERGVGDSFGVRRTLRDMRGARARACALASCCSAVHTACAEAREERAGVGARLRLWPLQ